MCGGVLVAGDGDATANAVNTDSRKIGSSDLFVALVGERFDAHDFVPQVAAAGAAGVMVSRVPENAQALGCGIIQVEDTLLGLQRLATAYRELLKPLVIGITGSNGKTSTKDLSAAVLAPKYQVRATLGNLNNHIGVPLTILSLEEGDTCAVVEMGMNHAGEIAPLVEIAKPQAAIITNIGVAHIEFLGSRAGIAQEKGDLAAGVAEGGVVVLNANDDMTPAIAARCRAKVVTAGVGAGDVMATIKGHDAEGTRFSLQFPSGETVEARLPVPGAHMVSNAALAAACAWRHGVAPQTIADALARTQLTKGRVQVKRIQGITFIDDSYNANPDSMKSGLQTLAGLSGASRKIAVLGRMGELGAHAAAGHQEVGAHAAQLKVDEVVTVGQEAALISDAARQGGLATRHFASHQEGADYLKESLKPGDAVLIKGSRSAAMEKILELYQS